MGSNDQKVDGFTVASPLLLKNSLARKLVPAVDKVRDLATKLGARAYRVRFIRTRWSGNNSGRGVEDVILLMEIVPTPKVVDLNTLDEVVTPVGPTDIGLVQLQQISGRYTEDQLIGRDPTGNPTGKTDDIFYEIEFFRPDGQESTKRRFVIADAPMYHATRCQWTITLQAQIANRRRDGRPRP